MYWTPTRVGWKKWGDRSEEFWPEEGVEHNEGEFFVLSMGEGEYIDMRNNSLWFLVHDVEEEEEERVV